MTCPICGGATVVINSVADCEGVYRRRKCKECDHRFYTTESEADGKDLNRIYHPIKSEARRRRNEARATENLISQK